MNKENIPPYKEIFQRLCGFYYPEQIHAFEKATIGFAGCGAGSNTAYLLAKHGIGHIKLADPETFEPTNTNRQVGCRVDTIGLKKVKVLKEILSKINPHAAIDAFPEGITRENVEIFVEGCDVILDMIDYKANPARLLMHKYARQKDTPIISTPIPGNGAVAFVFTKESMPVEEAFALDKNGNCHDLEKMHKLITGKHFSNAPDIFFRTWLKEKNPEDYAEFHLDKPYISTNSVGVAIGGGLAAQLTIKFLLLKDAARTKRQRTNTTGISIPVMPHYTRIDLDSLDKRTGVFDVKGKKVPARFQETIFLTEDFKLIRGKRAIKQKKAMVNV